jgi:hypothetical protein
VVALVGGGGTLVAGRCVDELVGLPQPNSRLSVIRESGFARRSLPMHAPHASQPTHASEEAARSRSTARPTPRM